MKDAEVSMIVNIIGRHPVPQPGFDGVMSLYEALWFSRIGDDVVLYMPFPDESKLDKFRRKLGGDLDALDKLDANFRIEPLLFDGSTFRPSDVTIWQSRSHDEWNALYPIVLARSRVVTKNFPKLVPQGANVLHRNVVAQLSNFDYAALALREDVVALQAQRDFYQDWSHRVGYAPRGADPVLLHPGNKVGRQPVVAIDTPNTGDLRAVQHFHKPLKRLKAEFPSLEVITLGRDVGLDWATRVPFGRFDHVYDQFFNRAWLYLTIDYGYSPQHLQGTIHELDLGNWSRKAVYEVQNIEAQMSGAVVVGHSSNLIPELFEPGESGVLFRSFDDPDEIFDRLAGVIDSYDRHRAAARSFALRHHSWEDCIAAWRRGLQALVFNGYHRDPAPVYAAVTAPAPPAQAPEMKEVAVRAQPKLRMSPAEKDVFLRYLQGASALVEYGTGGTTQAAVHSAAEQIYSVESDSEWLHTLVQDPDVAVAIESGRLTVLHIDLGPTGAWGHPITRERHVHWPDYAETVWLRSASRPIDFVLIDGRFRVYCAAVSLANVAPEGIVMFHDFWDRPYYHEVLKLAEVVDRVESIAVLKPRQGLQDIGPGIANKYRFDPR